MLDLEFTQLSDPGRVRTNNEDALGYSAPATLPEVRSRGWLFALADGVGGQERGEVASQLAVDTIVNGFSNSGSSDQLNALLPRLVQSANEKIYVARGGSDARTSGMASTVVACALRFDQAVVSHVGDSRAYLIRGGRATPLTRDHTMAEEQVRLGVISRADASSMSHILSRSLGGDMFVSVDTTTIQVLAEDKLMLCSDGLHCSMPAAEIAHVINEHEELAEAASKLIAIANERDGSDNISIQLIRINSVERVGMYRGRPYKIG
jgi:protein phosphatase